MPTLKKTLGEIRSDILVRLGFGAGGSAAITNSTLIDSFIRDAQYQLYNQFDWKELIKYNDVSTGVDQSLYDYPDDCNIERVMSVEVKESDTWYPLKEGIIMDMRSHMEAGRPCRYERFEQMEVWPPADLSTYTLRVWYVKALPNLVADNDRMVIDSNLVFLHALTAAKSHYRQPDASIYSGQLEALLNRLRAKNRTSEPIRRSKTGGEWDFISPPRVV